MIELKVESYCHDCPDFEADVSKRRETLRDDGSDVALLEYQYTMVRCAHAARCRAVKRYLEKQQKGE